MLCFSGSQTPHCFSTSTGTITEVRQPFRDMCRGMDVGLGGVRLGFAAATFGGFFFFSFLVSPSSLSRFEGFFFGGVASPFTLSAVPHMSKSPRSHKLECIPSSFFLFFLVGIVACSPWGISFPSSLAFSFFFSTFFSFEQDSRCERMASRRIGRLHRGQEIKSGLSVIGTFPKTKRSRGSSCFETGDPRSPTPVAGGD